MRQFSVKYRRVWLVGPLRAFIFDGVRWVKLSKESTIRQREIDALFERNEIILRAMAQ